MKIYFIDKNSKYLSIKAKLAELGIENIEHKTDIKHRINKTDYVITVDFENDYEEYKKINNLIVLTDKKDKNIVWNIANKLNAKDIILSSDEDYIAKRIKNIIN